MWNETGKRPIWHFLALTFGIAWFADAIMFLGERIGILTGNAGKTAITVMICLGVACAPAYAMLILLKKFKQVVSVKEMIKRIVYADNIMKTILITLAFFGELFLVKTMTSVKLVNYPWYYFLSLPLMVAALVFGGGLEELGWRGFLQPSLEKKVHVVVAILMTGTIWAFWHLPLWLVQGAIESTLNFFSFWLFCIVMSFILVAAYKLTDCILSCVLIHAWNNVLGGLFIGDSLAGLPSMELVVIYLIEVIVSIFIIILVDKNKSNSRKNGFREIEMDEKILI